MKNCDISEHYFSSFECSGDGNLARGSLDEVGSSLHGNLRCASYVFGCFELSRFEDHLQSAILGLLTNSSYLIGNPGVIPSKESTTRNDHINLISTLFHSITNLLQLKWERHLPCGKSPSHRSYLYTAAFQTFTSK